ncbi:MAG: glycosyltransferase family 2 protein [Candidatus Eisenbacteria bacterium]|nr:glycosyltransferase family 2 protein [Candidatus Eisenbacteria bacterium]
MGGSVSDRGAPEVSVVIPVMNESESIPVLADEVRQAFDGSEWVWECLWIDDGSTDGTLDVLRKLNHDDPRQRFISHDRNYGQSGALLTGLSAARGRIIATLDGDLQNDPADLPRLIRTLKDSDVHMVNGIRTHRQDSWLRKVSSKIANGFRNRMSGATATDVGCSVRAFYRECMNGVPPFHGMHRFLPTLVAMRGWRVTETPVNHRPRVHGRTSYGVHNRLWVGIADTFGVRWLASRIVNPRIAQISPESMSRGCNDG